MLGGAFFSRFSGAIVVDDPEQKLMEQTCQYIGYIRVYRQG